MKYLKSIFMLLIVSVVLMACQVKNSQDNIITNDNGQLIKIYSDSNLVIYKHKINPNHGWSFIYVNKDGGVVIWNK